MDRVLEFTGNHTVLAILLLISFFVLVFSELRRKASDLAAVAASDAVRLINNDGIVIDLRSTEAYAKGHIVNAKNFPFDEFEAHKDKVTKFKNKPVVAVCDTGMTSSKAVASLRNSGFESIYGLKGGMNAWSQAGLPVVTGKKTKSKA